MGKNSHYLTVARTKVFTLSYPIMLWEKLTPKERRAVVARQAALLGELESVQKGKETGPNV